MIRSKKGVIPAIVGTEVHFALIGIIIGIVIMVLLLVLGKSGTLPFKLCNLLC